MTSFPKLGQTELFAQRTVPRISTHKHTLEFSLGIYEKEKRALQTPAKIQNTAIKEKRNPDVCINVAFLVKWKRYVLYHNHEYLSKYVMRMWIHQIRSMLWWLVSLLPHSNIYRQSTWMRTNCWVSIYRPSQKKKKTKN